MKVVGLNRKGGGHETGPTRGASWAPGGDLPYVGFQVDVLSDGDLLVHGPQMFDLLEHERTGSHLSRL